MRIRHAPYWMTERRLASAMLARVAASMALVAAVASRGAGQGTAPPARPPGAFAGSAPGTVAVAALAVILATLIVWQVRRVRELRRMRAAFLASVSHELRTPLAQIRLHAELLQDETLRSDEERRRWARLIDQESQRLAFLVENALTYPRLERRGAGVRKERFELAAAVAEVAAAFEPLARTRRVALSLAIAPDLQVQADRTAFRQIVFNLLDNAVKYGPVGQTITLGAARTAGGINLWVEDAGPGIPERDRGQVWRPFARLARPVEAASGGSGIGLAIVRRLAEQHGGSAWIASASGGGARVGVTFPGMSPGAEVSADAAAGSHGAPGVERSAAGSAASGSQDSETRQGT